MVLAVIRQHYDSIYSKLLSSTQSSTAQTTSTTTTGNNTVSSNPSTGDFNGKVSYQNLLETQGQAALEQHITNQVKSSGADLSQYEGQTFTIANREFNENDSEGLKKASGKYNDELVVAKVVNGQIKLVKNKVYNVATTPDILSDYTRNDRALVPSGQIEKYKAGSQSFRGDGRIAFHMVDGWNEVN